MKKIALMLALVVIGYAAGAQSLNVSSAREAQNRGYLDKAKKEEIFGKYGKSTTDTGSAEAQIALFSYRISHLTEHLKKNHKDHSTARSLTMLVGKRRKLLKYLYNNDINRYRAIIKALGLRK
jgi:small subunit ribosomal protein S15